MKNKCIRSSIEAFCVYSNALEFEIAECSIFAIQKYNQHMYTLTAGKLFEEKETIFQEKQSYRDIEYKNKRKRW